jgi:membrane protein DedA with SNARE-associated domain
MTEYIQFLTQYGYLLVFAWVLLDQAGLPLPTVPVLLAAGALCGSGELNL